MKEQNKIKEEDVLSFFANHVLEIKELLLRLIKNQTPSDEYLDSADVKRILKISDSTLYRYRKNHIIPMVKYGKKLYCRRSSLLNMIKNKEVKDSTNTTIEKQ